MAYPPPAHSCRLCGASNYRRVVARDEHGAQRPIDLFQCSGCSVVFTDPKAWREGNAEDMPLPRPPVVAPAAVMGEHRPPPPGPNLATYGGGRPPASPPD